MGVFQNDTTSSWSLGESASDLVLKMAFAYSCELVMQELLWLMRYSHGLPGKFAALLKNTTRDATLQDLKSDWNLFMRMEDMAKSSNSFAEVFKLCVWPRLSWVLQVLVGLAEQEFETVDQQQLNELRDWSRCPKTTKQIEDAFGACRAASLSSGSRMCGERVFHTLHTSGIAESADRPVEKATNQAKLCAAQIPPSAFKANSNTTFSLDNKLLDDFMTSNESELSAQNYLLSPLRWLAMKSLPEDFSGWDALWLSLLCRPQTLLYKSEASCLQAEGLVIGVSEVGVVLLPLRLAWYHGFCYCKLDFRDGAFQWEPVFMTDMNAWRVGHCSIRTKLPDNTTPPGAGLFLLCDQERAPEALYKSAARDGFRGMKIHYMEKMCVPRGIDMSSRPRLEKDLAFLCV